MYTTNHIYIFCNTMTYNILYTSCVHTIYIYNSSPNPPASPPAFQKLYWFVVNVRCQVQVAQTRIVSCLFHYPCIVLLGTSGFCFLAFQKKTNPKLHQSGMETLHTSLRSLNPVFFVPPYQFWNHFLCQNLSKSRNKIVSMWYGGPPYQFWTP